MLALGSGWLEASLGWQVMNLLSIPVVLLAIVVIFYFHTKELIVLESR
jgi:hypothetical protein